ncbi:hypothetical protein [Paraburkholderia strydomiana]|uniref:hypothetical protein n=1 Tax=Paraburkholderia strydomiana TaxID=1245417 RepID=UPI001BEB8136|nr:hypothetical protein [Paraburkholderia strydomiana]MBT2789175.1 hypothetical protein [Paraburkholderia strydomiana]
MGRARTLKGSFFQNEILGALPPLARLLFAGLWTIADRDGRLEDRPLRIAAAILPYDREADVDALLDLLDGSGFIHRYAHGGAHFIQICAWAKHQRPHPHEIASTIPPCDCDGECRDASERKQDLVTATHDQGEARPGQRAYKANTSKPEPSEPSEPFGPSGHSRLALSPVHTLKPREKNDSRGARLPEAWALPAEWGEWAARECGFSRSHVALTAADFADYWHAKAGANACKRDWLATWRRWCRKARDDARGPPHGNGARDDRDRAMVTALTGRDPWSIPPSDVFDLAPQDVRHVPDRRH